MSDSIISAASDRSLSRRNFLRSGATAGGVLAAGASLPVIGQAAAAEKSQPPETVVKLLYDSLNEKQRREVCFDWDYVDGKRGLLRTRIQNNWKITKPSIRGDFYTKDQQQMIRDIFLGMTNPAWHGRWDKQLKDDVGGFGNRQSIAIFGTPGSGKFEFVLASRHMTLRCDGDSADHVAFGGPILYAHEGEALFEEPHHPSNVFWPQAVEANKLFGMLDGKQQKQALVVKGMPKEDRVGFRGAEGEFQGVRVSELSRDQQGRLGEIVEMMLEPFRQSDQDEATKYLKSQGGLAGCHLAFYQEGDMGEDGIYDNWRIEGPSFVWYFRGRPHVHVWVNVADSAEIELNAFENSVL